MLVFDDVHWAEPTFLELVEHLAEKGEASILVVCMAREELLEDRSEFLDGLASADRIVLDVLSADETDALLDGLGGGSLESDQRARIVATAEGNPFFLEQLLALALEGGLADRQLPETIQALLAARLDRLGPGERAVLERASVIGKRFRLDDVMALLDPEALPTADSHIRALVTRGFIRPVDGDLRFRHVLVQQAVYRAAPKRLRAELHERFTDQFEQRYEDAGDVDEFAGYHLEQAYRLRTELGESDRRTEQLAEDAGRRLGAPGFGPLKRGDVPAAIESARTCDVDPASDQPLDGELLMRARDRAVAAQADRGARRSSTRRRLGSAPCRRSDDSELRARIELEYVRLPTEPGDRGRASRAAVATAIPVFEAAGDDQRALGRAWLLAGWVRGRASRPPPG